MTTTGKKSRSAAAAKPADRAPQQKPAEKPTHVSTRKGVEGQVCLGACGKWKPLTDYGKTSKARGGKPMRRCRACITAEAQARKAAKPKAAKPAKAKPTARPEGRRET